MQQPQQQLRSSSPLAVGIAVLAVALFAVFVMRQAPISIDGGPDFPNYYFSGERLLSGSPVYEDLADEVAEKFGPRDVNYPADPPPTLTLLAPLSLLPYSMAWIALAGLSTLIVAGVVYLVARDLEVRRDWATAAAGLALVSTVYRFHFTRNHIEALLLCAGYLGWRALRAGRHEAGGAWWGIATALKLFPGMWLVGLARNRSWRALGAAAVTAGLLVLLGVAAVGVDESWRFVTEIMPRSRQWYGALGNYSLLSFGTALSGAWLGWLLTAAGLAALGSIFLAQPAAPDRIWAAGTALALLLSPLSWLNYLVLTFPALLLVGVRLDLSRLRVLIGYVALVGGLAFWGPVVFQSEIVTVVVSFVPTYALVALFILSMRVLPDEEGRLWEWRSPMRSRTSR